jgi:predicted ATPase/DNA-binding winged helix-turn-helix (wHTH) protein
VVDALAAERLVSFGPFHLLPAQRLLLEGDKPVRLGSRALDILIALVERPGELVGKDELMARVWPNTVVEESNLKFQISALRRTLGGGNRYLVNIPGRGYCFTAPVTRSDGQVPSARQATGEKQVHNLPAHPTRVIGRADTVNRLAARLPRQRFLTIVGPGGIGKTTVALATAETLTTAYEHGVWLIDLGPLSDPRLAPTALASALGLEIRADNPLPGLIAFLRDKQMLLVLDNCEHVIEAAAALALAILKGAAGVHILATSREPLRVEGEHVHRLSPLASPPASAHLTAADALGFSAVQLFVDRATASLDEFELSDADAPIVADICRQLDGIPLALELAAARVDAFGVRGLAAHLDDRFRLLAEGRRAVPPRHRTLSATLDWSYRLLKEAEQRIFRRLAIFADGFTLDAAGAVAADATQPEREIIDQVADLVAKSLVAADVGDAEPRLRLLDTTRVYALEKLIESGEREQLARRHAEYYRDLFEQAETELERRPRAEWLAEHGRQIDNLRAALDWAFSPGGDASIAVALTAAAVPLWMQLSLLEECRGRVEQALAAFGASLNRDSRCEMRLHAALGAALMYTRGAVPEIGTTWTKALEIAQSLNDTEYQLRSLWGLWSCHSRERRSALILAQKIRGLAENRPDPNDRLICEWMIGVSQHFLGDHLSARRHFERMLADYVALDRRSYMIRFQIDMRVSARVFLAWTLWLQGFPDQAMQTAESSVEDAGAVDHPLSLCYALARAACPIALLVGDLAAAEHYVRTLLDHSTRHALAHWRAIGRCHQGVLAIQRSDVVTGLRLLRAGFDELAEARFAVFRLNMFLMVEALGHTGQVAEGLSAVEEAIAWTERTEEHWAIAELLRIKGALLLLQDPPGAAATADYLFRQALDWARLQGALSCELRAATSLARLQRDQGHVGEGRDLLSWCMAASPKDSGPPICGSRGYSSTSWPISPVGEVYSFRSRRRSPLRAVAQVGPRSPITGDFAGIRLATAPPGSGKRPRTSSCRRNRPGVQCR